MKFKLLSDLHLEFYGRYRGGMLKEAKPWIPTPTEEDKDTILLLAGDIHVGKNAEQWIDRMCKRFYEVVYIAGNHEFYGNEFDKILKFWKEKDQTGNFTFLEDDWLVVEDVRIFGATLWTYITQGNLIWNAKDIMNDYRVIKRNLHGQYRRLNVQDTNEFHANTVRDLKKWLETPWKGKTIVMTHHLPHPLCVHEFFKNSTMNPFFMTNLDEIIEQYDINVWCHGHTHTNVDVEVHGTRILCNPMGYHGVELNQNFNEGLIFDV